MFSADAAVVLPAMLLAHLPVVFVLPAVLPAVVVAGVIIFIVFQDRRRERNEASTASAGEGDRTKEDE